MLQLPKTEWDGLVFTNDVSVKYFNLVYKPKPRVDYTKNVIRTNAPVFYFNEHSILTWMFNRKIEICDESGLILHWTSQYESSRKIDKQRQPKKLSIHGILAMLEITAVFYSIAFIIFLMEILSHANRRIKGFLDYLTY